MNRPLSRVKCFMFTARLVSMGIAGLGAGQLRDRDGVSKGCVVRRGTELLFAPPAMSSSPPPLKYTRCHCWHKHHYTPSNHQLLFPSCPPALCPSLVQETIPQTSQVNSPCCCCFLLPRPLEMPATAFSAFLCHPTALQPGHGCYAVRFPSSSVLATVRKDHSQWSSGCSLCPACVTPSPPALWEAGLVSQLLRARIPSPHPPTPPISYPFLGCSVSSLFIFLPPPGAFVGV